MRAILIRGKMARDISSKRESLIRRYDGKGRVLEERVWRESDSSFVTRPQTLPQALSERSLESFLPTTAGRFGSSNMIAPPALATLGGTETVGSTVVTIADTIETTFGGPYSLSTQDATVDTFNFGSLIVWADSAHAGDMESSATGTMVMRDPEGSGYLEIVFSESEWADGVSAFLADTSGSTLRDGASQSGDSFLFQASCAGAKTAFYRAAVVTGASLVVGGVAVASGVPAGWFLLRRGLTSLGYSGYKYLAMKEACGV
jgi:hypothetical protein